MARPRPVASVLALALLLPAGPAAASDLAACLEGRALPRVARVVAGPGGAARWARVVADEDGVPTRIAPLGEASLPLAAALARAAAPPDPGQVGQTLDAAARRRRLCSPVPLRQAQIDAEERVVVAAGLNYAAHADEAGGGDVFVFPKPVAPGPPYGTVAAPAGAVLFDYEVELGFVLLDTLPLDALPSREGLLAASAFFVANDLTDREPILVHKAWTGPGTGFVDAKGQPGFLPLGPWLVRGTELFAALEACGAEGLGLHLAVDEGDGFAMRQEARSQAMILDPVALLARIAREVERRGLRTAMPLRRADPPHHYPLAVPGEDGRPVLPAGSIVLTGTPAGVAFRTPGAPGLVGRGLLHLRGPFEQLRREERERAAAGGPGGYLEPGDRVRARIDGLGAQVFRVAGPGTPPAPDPCDPPLLEAPR